LNRGGNVNALNERGKRKYIIIKVGREGIIAGLMG
jgi:hypothetical protein